MEKLLVHVENILAFFQLEQIFVKAHVYGCHCFGGGQIFQSVVRYDAGGKQFFTFGSALPSSPTEESTSLKIQRTAILKANITSML